MQSLMDHCNGNAAEAITVSEWLYEVTDKVNQFLKDTRHSREAVTKIAHARLLAITIILRNFSPNQEKELLDQWEKTSEYQGTRTANFKYSWRRRW